MPIHSMPHNVSILTTPSWRLPSTALYTMSVYSLHLPNSCQPQHCTQCQYTHYTFPTPAIHSTVHNVSILTTPSQLLPSTVLYTMSVYSLHLPNSCHPQYFTQCQYTPYTFPTPAIHSTLHNVSILTTPSQLLPSKALYTICSITSRTHI